MPGLTGVGRDRGCVPGLARPGSPGLCRGGVPGDRGGNRGNRGEKPGSPGRKPHRGGGNRGCNRGDVPGDRGGKPGSPGQKPHRGGGNAGFFSRKSRVTGAKKPGSGRCTGAKTPEQPGFRLLSGRILPGSGAGRDGFASSLARTCARTRRAFRAYKEVCRFWEVFLKFLTKSLKKGVDFPGLQSDVCHRAEAHSPARPRVGKATGSGRSP